MCSRAKSQVAFAHALKLALAARANLWIMHVAPESVAATRERDLIVLTTAGHHGILDALRGGTTERILRSARCPVLATPANSATEGAGRD